MAEQESSPKCYSLALADEEESSRNTTKSAMASLKCGKLKKKTVYVVIGVLLMFIVLSVILATQLKLKGSGDCPSGVHCDWKAVPSTEFLKDGRCQDVCNTRSCIKAAMYTMDRIDPSQDPCEDFYNFACGTYKLEASSTPGRSTDEGDSSTKELERDFISDIKDVLEDIPLNGTGMKGSALRFVKTFYSNCLMGNSADFESRTSEYLNELFVEHGSLPWPLVNKGSSSSSKKLESSLAFLSSVSSNPLFQTELVHRSRNKWVIEMDIPKFGRLSEIYAEDDEKESNRTKIYMQAMLYSLEIMGVDNVTRRRTVEEVANLEKKVVEISRDSSSQPPSKLHDRQYTCEEMSGRLRAFNWCSFATHFLPLLGISPNIRVAFHINSLPYFQAINRVLERTVSRDLVNYLNTKFLINFQQYLTERFQYYYYHHDDTFSKLPIYRSTSTHWQRCVLLTMEQLWPIVHDRYISTKFDAQKREKVEEMISVMNATMVSTIAAFPWMDQKDKKILIAEFNDQSSSITLEKIVPSQAQLDELFSMMSTEERPLIENALELMKLKNTIPFSSKINPIIFRTSEPFFIDNLLSSEVATPIYGSRYFRFPILDFDRPKYLDYSTLGTVIMFPMTRVILHYTYFKSEMNEYDVVRERNQCIQEQISHYGKDRIGANESETVVGFHNLFDAVTLQSTFRAYKEYLKKEGQEKGLPGLPLSNQQLFFISFAQLYCESGTPIDYDRYSDEKLTPADVRVNGVLSQSSDFAKAFRCSVGSPLNPSTKCCLMSSKEIEKGCI